MVLEIMEKLFIGLGILSIPLGVLILRGKNTVVNVETLTGLNPIDAKFCYDVAERLNAAGLFKTYIDPVMVATMCKIESNFNPKAERKENHIKSALSDFDGYDISFGLMQVLTSTANDLYKNATYKGYRAYGEPTLQSLVDPVTNIYFGMAYIDWLQARAQRNGLAATSDRIVQWYNGGYGNSNSQTQNHLRKYNATKPTIESEINES